MNTIYRLVWNARTHTAVAVMETARARGPQGGRAPTRNASQYRPRRAALGLWAALALAGPALAGAPAPTQLPTGGQVVAGQAQVTPTASNVLQVNQSSQAAVLNWQSFDLGSAASVNFVQPSAASSTLNRVLDGKPSQIYGRITAPGQVFFTNPSGIYFGPSANVDVGGLVATTHSISDADFMAGNYRLARNGASGSVVNAGTLQAALGGYIALLAPEVRNQGVVVARLGTVALAAGDMMQLEMLGSQLAKVRVSPSSIQALVDNASAVLAPGGLIILSAQAADQLQGSVVNNSGSLVATGLALRNGRVVLEAGANGSVQAGGTLDASNASGTGGSISITGRDIVLPAGAQLLASGSQGGGSVLVGGDWQGSGTLPQAHSVRMDAGARIDASASAQGDGGKVVLWSDIHDSSGSTTAAGSIQALGAAGGQGGRVETSGHQLRVQGLQVKAGRGGQWLLDPDDIDVSTGGTVDPATIAATLDGGADVVLNTSPGVGGSGDIFVNEAITSTSAGAGGLSLIADRDIYLNAGISLSGTGKPLLAKAQGFIVQNPSVAISTQGGDVTYWADSDSNHAGGIFMEAGSSVTTNGGNVVFGGGNNPALEPAGSTPYAATYNKAVMIRDGASIAAGTGNVSIRGTSYETDHDADGLFITGIGTRISGATITLVGHGSDAGDYNSSGVAIEYYAQVSGSTAVNITGVGGASTAQGNFGVAIKNAGTLVEATGTGTLTIHGTGGGSGAASSGNNGVNLFFDSTVRSHDGALTVVGTGGSVASGDNNAGVALSDTSVIESIGLGAVSITGTGGGTGPSGGNVGIDLEYGPRIASNAGALSLNGSGGNGSGGYNVGVQLAFSTVQSGNGTLSLSGTGSANSGSNNYGTALYGAVVAATGSGSVTLTGNGGGSGASASNDGIHSEFGTSIGTAGGTLSLSGTGGSGSAGDHVGVRLIDSTVGSASTGAITVSGSGGNGGTGNWGVQTSGSTVLGNSAFGSSLHVAANSLDLSGLNINGTGNVTIDSIGASFTAPLDTGGIAFDPNLSALTIGKPGNTASITLGSSTSIAGPVSVYGGQITVNAALAAAGNLLLDADTGSQLGFDGAGVAVNAGISTSANGNITVNGRGGSGGADNQYGIAVTTADISAGGTGTISLTGRGGAATGFNNYGIYINAASASNIGSSNGNISLTGFGGGAGPTTTTDAGVFTGTNSHILAGGAGTVSITGTGSAAASNGNGMRGIYIRGTVNSSGGAITLTGTGGANATGAANTQAGIQIDSTGNVGAQSGNAPITLVGADTRTGAHGIRFGIGSLGGSSYNGNILLRADGISQAPSTTSSIDTGGTLTVEPLSPSFVAALDTTPFVLSRITGLTLGKPGNTADITWGSAASINGPVSLYGGNLAINAALTASGSNTVTLASSGAITESASGALTASQLQLQGGNATLINAGNNIGTLAASGMGSLVYADSDALTIGTVGSTQGIQASGPVSVATLTGNLTLAQGIGSSDSSANALVLNAGQSAAAGDATGGNIVVVGAPTLSVGAGGVAKLYTGSVAGSSGLAALVGAGSGRFRYHSDEASSGYTLALAANGANAIYREQPTLTLTPDSQTITYGTVPTLGFGVAGGNGDTAAQALATAPSIAVGGSSSGAGFYTANSPHSLTASGAVDQLGYAISYAPGSLTVNPKPLSYTGSAISRAYNGGTSVAMVDTAAGIVAGDAVAVASAGANFIPNGNVGSGKAVAVSGITLSGLDAGNYQIASSASSSGDITAKLLTLSASKVYDGSTDLAGAVTLGGLVAGETLGYSATALDAHVASAGNFITSLALSNGSGLASNYQLPVLNVANAPVTITRRDITLGGLAVANKTYDGNTIASVTGGNFANLVSGETLGLGGSGSFADAKAGAGKTVTVANVTALTQTDGTGRWSDYHLVTTGSLSGSASIAPKTVTLTAGSVAKTYDGLASYSATATDLAALSSQLGVAGDSVAAATMGFLDANVGSGKALALGSVVVNDGNGGGNYQLSLAGNSSSAITAAPLTVRALDDLKTRDGRAYTGGNGVVYSGFVHGETAAVLGGTLAYGGSSQGAVRSGNYAISVQGLSASNYQLSYQDGTLRIVDPVPPPLPPQVHPLDRDRELAAAIAAADSAATPRLRPPQASEDNPQVQLQLVRLASEQRSGFTLVYVPTALRNRAQGWHFSLPPAVQEEMADAVQVSTLSGQPLPDWLRFNRATQSFEATGVPPGGLPLRLRLVSGRLHHVLELLEATI